MDAADYQRARSPLQQQHRRETILAAARGMLDHRPAAEVSLRELSREVGLSKSNVTRYFPTREAVFLAVLIEDWDLWLADLELALPLLDARRRPQTQNQLVADATAQTLNGRPRLCNLLATSPSVLEHNVPTKAAREFKLAAQARLWRFAQLLAARVPALQLAEAFQFAGLTWATLTGLWPMANPAPVVAAVVREPELTAMSVEFAPALTRTLRLLLDGLTRQE